MKYYEKEVNLITFAKDFLIVILFLFIFLK